MARRTLLEHEALPDGADAGGLRAALDDDAAGPPHGEGSCDAGSGHVQGGDADGLEQHLGVLVANAGHGEAAVGEHQRALGRVHTQRVLYSVLVDALKCVEVGRCGREKGRERVGRPCLARRRACSEPAPSSKGFTTGQPARGLPVAASPTWSVSPSLTKDCTGSGNGAGSGPTRSLPARGAAKRTDGNVHLGFSSPEKPNLLVCDPTSATTASTSSAPRGWLVSGQAAVLGRLVLEWDCLAAHAPPQYMDGVSCGREIGSEALTRL